MIGIGVGIDYALFIVTRYREALHRTGSPEAAVLEAMTTSGRAVVFAGFTVMISVLGMFLMGLNFLHGLAVGTSLAVVDRGARRDHAAARAARLRRLHDRPVQGRPAQAERRRGDVAPLGPARAAPPGGRSRSPASPCSSSSRCPTFSLRLGSADASNDPKSSTTHQAYDLIAEGFGPARTARSSSSPTRRKPGSRPRCRSSSTRCAPTPGVASVSDADAERGGHGRARDAASRRPDRRTRRPSDLVHHLRDDVVPGAVGGHRARRCTSAGRPRAAIDFTDVIGERLPIFIGARAGAELPAPARSCSARCSCRSRPCS